MKGSLKFIKRAHNSKNANGGNIRLLNLGPIASSSSFKLTTGSMKHVEGLSHDHIVSLLYKLKTSAKNSDDLSVGFDGDKKTRRNQLTNNKNVKGNLHVRIMLRDVSVFVEHQEKATYGLG